MDLHPHEAPKRVHRGELLSFARVEHGGVFVLSSPLLPITLRLQQGTPVSRASSHRLAVWLRDRTGRCRGFHHRHSGEDMTSEAAVEVKCGRPQRVSPQPPDLAKDLGRAGLSVQPANAGREQKVIDGYLWRSVLGGF